MHYFNSLLSLCVLALVCLQVNSQCTSTVKRGSTGECVKVVQRAVGVTTDGNFGPKTESAVRKFQLINSLTSDGIVGRNTWAAINSGGSGGGSSNNCGCGYDNTGSACSAGATSGALNLRSYMHRMFSRPKQGEIHDCRNVRGGSKKSLHAEGRALDFYPSSSSVGAQAFNHMISIACQNGIQEVIYNRRIWTSGRGVHQYNGANPHTDHVHVGLNRCGARNFNL